MTNPSTQAARVLLQALAALGVREVVLAPGSRSAPLAYAVAEAARHDADRDPAAPRLDLHVRVDERSAGFLALGLARGAAAVGRARPVAVVTTSGTAVANLHPAVLEAHHSGLPLLLLTADRPHELRGTGANQTTEQVGLLEPVRLTLDVPAPTGRPGEDRDLRHVAARAVAAATGARTGTPGPVHVNLAFREPLVPDVDPWPASARAGEPGSGLTEVLHRGAAAGAPSGARPTAPLHATGTRAGGDGVRTVVVAGDGAGPLARRVAEANAWPLLAEPSSGARSGPNAVPAYRLLLGEATLGGEVQRVVVLGRPTLSRPVQALLARRDVEVMVVAPAGADWPDAARNAAQVLTEVPPLLLDGCLGAGVECTAGPWLAAWQRAGRAAASALARTLADDRSTLARTLADDGSAVSRTLSDDHADAPPPLTGPALAAVVAGALGPDDLLVLGSSNPVRDVDLVAAWDEAPTVLANRGLAGIDGTLSTAAGVALATGGPVLAYLGDLTFLHEAGGLLVGPLERRPDLTVVVANDEGGSIFATLEHGEPERTHVFERVFGTPHGADLAGLCAGYGVPHVLARTADDVRAALAVRSGGMRVVEVAVDRASRRDLHARLAGAVRTAVDAAPDDVEPGRRAPADASDDGASDDGASDDGETRP